MHSSMLETHDLPVRPGLLIGETISRRPVVHILRLPVSRATCARRAPQPLPSAVPKEPA